ncbi:MAG: radical SAM protein [Methanobacteriota archaeon]
MVVKKKNGKSAFIHPDIPKWLAFRAEGARTLELCDGTRSERDIIETISREFNEPMEYVGKGVAGLLSHCEKQGFFQDVTPKRPDALPVEMKILYLNITRECNLRCTYCYASAGAQREKELTLEEIKKLLSEFHALGKGTRQNVIITGGEPLLRKDFWQIAEYARSLGLVLVLSSNGLLIDRETARKLGKLFGGVQISLDGDREMHDKCRGKGSFDGATRGIENLVEAGITPSISATVTKENFKKLDNLWDVCDKYKIKHVKTNPIIPLGRAESDRDEIMLSRDEYIELWRATKQQLKKRRLEVTIDNERSIFSGGTSFKGTGNSCGAGRTSISFESNGDAYPCQASHLPQFLCGNIREKSLEEIVTGAEVLKDWMGRSINDIPGCSSCEWKMYCGGGCFLQAALGHGTVHAPDVYCDVYKFEYEETFWEFVDKREKEQEESNDGQAAKV